MSTVDTTTTTGTYQLDPSASTITFTTRHQFGLAGVAGSFALRGGEVVVAEPLSASRVSATADATSFSTGNAKRDTHVVSETFLHVDAHPDITFTAQGLEQEQDGWVLRGRLTARGATAPLDLHVEELAPAGGALRIRATGTVDRYAHGITKMKGMAGRRLSLTIAAQATRA